MYSDKTLMLNNGVEVPRIQLGTWLINNDDVRKVIDDALDRFNLEYIDMLLIHSPQPWIEVNRINDRHFEGNLENWRAMEEALKAGKVRSIGVSNFFTRRRS